MLLLVAGLRDERMELQIPTFRDLAGNLHYINTPKGTVAQRLMAWILRGLEFLSLDVGNLGFGALHKM
jgi:hypothetical protein